MQQDKEIKTDNLDIAAGSIKEIDFSGLQFPYIVVYQNPDDYPEYYIGRVYDTNKPTNVIITRNTLEELQEDISSYPGAFFIYRTEDDDSVIVGKWILGGTK